ncbi:putative bifunctional diguanylate cyclase/phosphodiesterase [Phyllobacterium pellucidum]|uniref:putative bifunctional diguanylate cyclase/phosphodiesterase n=1 Tax=Phyllobacterium pellucidum TaxID=2740464 RepID=UPI001D14E51C|nr:GGDEF domain-containing phosphodiesterase [Phyllobacterium sp. T1018]UGY09616.1 EAL domain-containing protein [Phyllobacterium sp. T1018]
MKVEANDGLSIELIAVRTLYANGKATWWSSIIQILATATIYLKTHHAIYLAFALAFLVVDLARTANAGAFERANLVSASAATLKRWEWRYLLGALASCSVLGALCFVSIYMLPDATAAITSVIIVAGSMLALVTRNYVSPMVVLGLSIGILAPLCATLVLLGGVYNWLLALLILPYFWSNIGVAGNLRNSLFDALLGKRQLARVATNFDAALNGMPQGLLMFDGQQTITVANMKAAKMMGFDSPAQLEGRSLATLLRLAQSRSYFPEDALQSLRTKMQDLLSGSKQRDTFESPNKRHYEFTATPDPEHGTVLVIQDVTRRADAEAQINRMARFDSLTGLPNRSQFAEIAATYADDMVHGAQIALMVIDIDGLKRTNDTFGHRIGDEMLRAFADRLSLVEAERPLLSRFGSDEFVLLFSACSHEETIGTVERIMSAITGIYSVSGHDIQTGARAGVAIVEVDAFDLSVMHMNADLALDVAKKDSQKNWAVFVQTMDHTFRSKQRLRADLRRAIAEGTLSVAYQPIVNIRTSRMTACEALSRWDHPEFGAISPAEFIPLAEEMGLISDLTRNVIDRAVMDCRNWNSRIAVSVNLSSHDLQNRNTVSVIQSALKRHAIEPHLLEVEVTEGALITDRATTGSVLAELKGYGVQVAIDDFGTGYSSLSYLKNLPVNKVKIDRSFIADIAEEGRSLKLLRGIVHMSHELGLSVTIEGLETSAQSELVNQLVGAEHVQGFLYGAAMSADDIVKLLDVTMEHRLVVNEAGPHVFH